jgi:methylphosphotriester-DNA--protein-cysteine methyltransferase
MKPAASTTTTPVTAGIAGNPDGSCPASAPVKVSRSKIYHVPDGRSYAKTKAKSCFVSAQAAEQAGYRAPKK